MKKDKQTRRSLLIGGLLCLLFVAFLTGVMLWEHRRPSLSLSTELQTTNDSKPTESMTMTTEAAVPTTLPSYEARRVHFLLVGRDAHGPGENGRSDSMILCSVDTGAKRVTLISFLRDIYLRIPGHGSNRLNAAYSWGGAELLKQTLQENFGVTADVTLEIDFEGFQNVIDQLGGVDIDLTDEEADHLNNGHGWSLHAGVNHLDGQQALAYSRIRYLDSDFYRTERQRNVLTALLTTYGGADYVEFDLFGSFGILGLIFVAHIVLLLLIPGEDADFFNIRLQKPIQHRIAKGTGATGDQERFICKSTQ